MRQVENIKAVEQTVNQDYALYQGDGCELMQAIPDNSIHYGLHSPPFEGLYKFSNDPRDVSNSEGDDFWRHYSFMIRELMRVTMPGRLHSVHVMQLPASKLRDGFIGMRDFRGEVIRAYQDAGWIFHSEVCIWKDPVVAQQRTKSIRLLHRQVEKDSAMSGQGLPDYVVTFRKPGDNAEPVSGRFEDFIGDEQHAPAPPETRSGKTQDEARKWYSIEVWQNYASPVWFDINQSRTLQYKQARADGDEAHISPLQLDVIERCIELWSNPGDVVFSPFAGIGSEVYSAVEMGRHGVGIELKPNYYQQAVRNMQRLYEERGDLLATAGE